LSNSIHGELSARLNKELKDGKPYIKSLHKEAIRHADIGNMQPLAINANFYVHVQL